MIEFEMESEESLEEKNKRYKTCKEQLKREEEKIAQYEEIIRNLNDEIILLNAEKIQIKRGEKEGTLKELDKKIEKVMEEISKQEKNLKEERNKIVNLKKEISELLKSFIKNHPDALSYIDEVVNKQLERRIKKQKNAKTELKAKQAKINQFMALIMTPEDINNIDGIEEEPEAKEIALTINKGGKYLIEMISATKKIEELQKKINEKEVPTVPEQKPKWYQFIKKLKIWNKERKDDNTLEKDELVNKIEQEKEKLEINRNHLIEFFKEFSHEYLIDATDIDEFVKNVVTGKNSKVNEDGTIRKKELVAELLKEITKIDTTIRKINKSMKKHMDARNDNEGNRELSSSERKDFMERIAVDPTLIQEDGILSDAIESERRGLLKNHRTSKKKNEQNDTNPHNGIRPKRRHAKRDEDKEEEWEDPWGLH